MMFDFAVRIDFGKSENTDLPFESSSIEDMIFEIDLVQRYPKTAVI